MPPSSRQAPTYGAEAFYAATGTRPLSEREQARLDGDLARLKENTVEAMQAPMRDTTKAVVEPCAKRRKPKRQSRRSASVKGTTYARMKTYCDRRGIAVSAYLEDLIAADLDRAGEPVHAAPLTTPAKPKPSVETIVSQHFTF